MLAFYEIPHSIIDKTTIGLLPRTRFQLPACTAPVFSSLPLPNRESHDEFCPVYSFIYYLTKKKSFDKPMKEVILLL